MLASPSANIDGSHTHRFIDRSPSEISAPGGARDARLIE
jgi:hypothetical protein